MAELTIKNLDERLLRVLARRAEALGESMDETVDALLRLALLHDSQGRVAVADRIRAMTSRSPSEDSVAMLRRLRDGLTRNRVSPEEAVRISREMRGRAGEAVLPDSTPSIRHDRDTR